MTGSARAGSAEKLCSQWIAMGTRDSLVRVAMRRIRPSMRRFSPSWRCWEPLFVMRASMPLSTIRRTGPLSASISSVAATTCFCASETMRRERIRTASPAGLVHTQLRSTSPVRMSKRER